MNSPFVSIIIIDYKENNPYLTESFKAIKGQSYKNFEVILVTDYKNKINIPGLTKKYYGKYVGPAKKRDDGAKLAKGEILVFLDDDAYPSKNWLKEIVKEFQNTIVVAVGGPGVTPPNVNWQEETSGWAATSPLGSGKYLYRFLPTKRQFVDDYPSMNLAVRRKEFLSIGGFDSNYWPGEDTKLCLDLINKTNKKIVYNPKAVVCHHRRPIFGPHLRQNGNYGLHRGFFARVLPQTSLKPIYFLPSLLLLGFAYVFISFILSFRTRSGIYTNFPLFIITQYFLYLYLTLLTLNSFWILSKSKKVSQAVISIPVILITHLWYGVRFLQGLLFTDKLIQ